MAPDPIRSDFDTEFSEPDETWRYVRIRLQKGRNKTVIIELLRPQEWVESRGISIGGDIAVSLPELAARGTGRIEALEPAPPIDSGHGSVVIGRTQTIDSDEVTEIAVVPVDETGFRVRSHEVTQLTGTRVHPMWSVDRQKWVPLGELEVGEHLLTREGLVRVERVQSRFAPQPVYNLEIHGEHTYEVTNLGIVVHNTGIDDCFRMGLDEAIENGELSIVGAKRAGATRPPRHHIFPQEERAWFDERNFDIDKITVAIQEGEHTALHTMGWNKELMEMLKEAELAKNGGMLTPKEIWEIGFRFMRSKKLTGMTLLPYVD